MSNESDSTTNRRKLLGTIASGTLATSLIAWTASADDVSIQDCEEMVTQYQCVDSDCDCSECDCDCETKRQSRECCQDRYGDIVNCGGWQDTGECCTEC